MDEAPLTEVGEDVPERSGAPEEGSGDEQPSAPPEGGDAPPVDGDDFEGWAEDGPTFIYVGTGVPPIVTTLGVGNVLDRMEKAFAFGDAMAFMRLPTPDGEALVRATSVVVIATRPLDQVAHEPEAVTSTGGETLGG